MQLLIFLATVFFTFTVLLAGFIYCKNPQKATNRLFVLFSMPVAVWCFGFVFMTSAPDEAAARLWFRVMASGWAVIPPFCFHLVLTFTDNAFFKRHRWLYLPLYLPAVFLTYANVVDMKSVSGFLRSGPGWMYVYDSRSPWLAVNAVFVLAYITGALFLLFRLRLKSADRGLKKQSGILIITIIVSLGAFLAVTYFPVLFHTNSISYLDLITVQIWEIGLSYAIIRHGFMVISPESAAASILRTMADGLLLMDTGGLIIGGNRSLFEILEMDEKAVIGSSVEILLPKAFSEQRLLERLSSENSIRDMEAVFSTASGREVFLSLSASRVIDKFGKKIGSVTLLRDISERKRTEKQLQYLATHDSLTGLPNRVVLNDRLRNALARARRHGQIVGIVFIDVDHFKTVNDRFGHECGDLFLKAIADTLRTGVREYDTVSRMGGDEFVAVLADLPDRKDCLAVVSRLRQRFSRPLEVGEREITAGLSMGVSLYPLHADNIEDLYKCADMALYRVKESGRGDYHLYSPDIDAAARRSFKLEQELREAISKEQFELHYQPIYDTRSGELTSIEALLRWQHPELGVINPLDFIPVAEKSGLIIPLGEWVLNNVCRQQKSWEKEGLAKIPVTVNVSAKQFQDPELISKIEGALAEAGIEPQRLELELTESTAMVEVKRTIKTVRRLKEKGIAIVIDDFGSGYSSMSWLKQLDVRAIKIDRFFIQNITHDPHDAAIVKAIVSMAHSLGIQVVAEGVETAEQLEAIRSMRWDFSTELICDSVQGFLFSRPVPAEALASLLPRNPR